MSILDLTFLPRGLPASCLCVVLCLSWLSTSVIPTASFIQPTKSAEGFPDFCEQWVTFKDPKSGECLPCSPCPEDHLTVVKCEFDRDTLCRPLSDLASHIESVIHSTSSVVMAQKNNTMVILEQNTVFEQAIGGIEYSPALVAILALLVFGCVSYIILLSLKKCNKKNNKKKQLQDPLQESLLGLDDQEEDHEKPGLDMDEMLAQRYGRSLVTNVYVP